VPLQDPDASVHRGGAALEVLLAFARLGVSAFGGPLAHLGYLRAEFVVRRRWLGEAAFADLVALCQILPGPASSQVGFSIGLLRAGYSGALAAWTAFTLPSAAALVAFAYGAHALADPIGLGLLHGLRLAAVAVVAQAVYAMAPRLCPDGARAGIAVAAMAVTLFGASAAAPVLAICLGAIGGWWLCHAAAPALSEEPLIHVSRRAGFGALLLFFVLLVALPVLRGVTHSGAVAVFEAFYRSGALVFGGGHVVLPLLRDAVVVPGWVTDQTFLSGYGAAQAVPGPLFSFAAYLGAVLNIGPGGIPGAAIALVAIYIPGLLLLIGALPFWQALRRQSRAQAVLAGINAAVVGLLAAALYDPIWISAIRTRGDFVVAALGFLLLTVWRAPPLLVVLTSALGGAAFSVLAI
jgi:chromate transporter